MKHGDKIQKQMILDVCLELPGFEDQSVWVQALILSVTDSIYLELYIIYDTWQENNYINKWSKKIAQFESQTKESYELQNQIQPQMQVDSYDKAFWKRSTILKIDEVFLPKIDKFVKRARIGFRPFLSQTVKGTNVRNKEKLPALPCSAFGTIEELNSLTENGAYVDQATEFDESLLYIACQFGRYEIAEYLISKGANLNKRTDYDHSPVMAAIQEGHTDIVRLLVRNGADINMNIKNIYFKEQILSKDETFRMIYELERSRYLLIYNSIILPDKQEKTNSKRINKNILKKAIFEYNI
ncbi:ankyrin repeat-containing protein [Stylonychia lemnae]|uniref:Ankyrin repeat-containing protein n=1 Tax=Stylonychia lemnae TaxID=5949 RepID=A0A078AYF6_STYLE|nr:ankyrin repeat-containing protein [Stylonychia lemnae]|eukprot:CDW85823.1 ankyrin repeat-containing protein [Stylonychia lemnae]